MQKFGARGRIGKIEGGDGGGADGGGFAVEGSLDVAAGGIFFDEDGHDFIGGRFFFVLTFGFGGLAESVGGDAAEAVGLEEGFGAEGEKLGGVVGVRRLFC